LNIHTFVELDNKNLKNTQFASTEQHVMQYIISKSASMALKPFCCVCVSLKTRNGDMHTFTL